MEEVLMTGEEFLLLMNFLEERKEFVKACWECSNCDIFDKCQEEHRNYCEKEKVSDD